MTWLDWSARMTRYIGPKLQSRRSQPGLPVSLAEVSYDCSMPYPIESARWRDSRVRNALEYLTVLETDPDADDFAIAWARHELLRCVRAAEEDVLRDG